MVDKPVKPITIGGVSFDSNQIESSKTVKNKDGSVNHIVIFNSGVQVEFPEQRMESAAMYSELNGQGCTSTNIFSIAGAKVKGSSGVDYIHAHDVYLSEFDVKGDVMQDCVVFDSIKSPDGPRRNTVMLGPKDEAVRFDNNQIAYRVDAEHQVFDSNF